MFRKCQTSGVNGSYREFVVFDHGSYPTSAILLSVYSGERSELTPVNSR